MPRLEEFLPQLDTQYPLNILLPIPCISLSNSGRRGDAKEFYISIESFVSSLRNIRDHLDDFPSVYNQDQWRASAENYFVDTHAKTLCGVQTRPYFEMINKIVAWANELDYADGRILLTEEHVDNTLARLEQDYLRYILEYPLVDNLFSNDLTSTEIETILAEKLNDELNQGRTCLYYGFKYSRILDRDGISLENIYQIAHPNNVQQNSFESDARKGQTIFRRAEEEGLIVHTYFINAETPVLDNAENVVENNQEMRENAPNEDDQSPLIPTQIIYYGVPGCGKSYNVEKDIDKELNEHGVENKEYHKVRCVFHPEYTNADFVGQVYPFVDPDGHGVDYRFKPGPFAEIVRRAYHEPSKPFFLIVEEINRGNAAAIFGEMFQLLDRIKPGDNPDNSTENIYQPGWSSYGVSSTDVNAYIRQKTTDEEEIRAKRQNNESLFETEINFQRGDCAHVVVNEGTRDERVRELHFTWTTAIRLPPNLSIYATMNTSDQNVITMDNAFQRRFKSRMIRNDLKNAAQYNIKIEGTNVCWGAFRDWVNGKILSTPSISKADDKCLGGWFISTSVETKDDDGNVTKFKDISRADFAEKVIKYLWDDVFKRNATTVIFKKGPGNGEFKSLSELIDAFENETGQLSESFDKVFKLSEADKRNLIKDMNGVSHQAGLADEESVEGESVTDA